MISHAALPSTEDLDLERIEDLFTEWAEALTAGDSHRMAGLHHPQGVFQRPGAKGARGRDAIRRSCSGWLATGGEPHLALFETRLFEPADVATGNGRFTLVQDWEPCAENARGRFLLVAEKGESRWGLRFSGLFSDAFLRELHDLVS